MDLPVLTHPQQSARAMESQNNEKNIAKEKSRGEGGQPHNINVHVLDKELKVKNDHRSKFSNLSNWKEEA